MRLRPPFPGDDEAVAELLIARDVADLGEPDFTLEDLRGEWAASDFELAADAVVAEDEEGRLVGYAALRGAEALAVVHPEREGEGTGAALAAWLAARAVARGDAVLRQAVAEGNARARALLEAAGYARVRSYWRMEVALGHGLPVPDAPAGVTARALASAEDARALHTVSERAFAGNPDYRPEPLVRFQEEHLGAHDLDPSLSRVAERDGRVVGFALCRRWPGERAYVDLLAVDPAEQRAGIGSWLLARVLAGCREGGLAEALLSVASDNPRALVVYERAGMGVRWRFDEWQRQVSTGSLP